MQHHAHHRTPRPLLAMRRALGRRLHQPRAMQMQLGHRVAQCVIVPLAQLLMEMLHREAAIEVAVKPKHPLDLGHWRSPQRRSETAVSQTRLSHLRLAVTPAAECPFADAQ